MKLTKIKPKFIEKHNPRIGLITLATDFRIEKDFNNVIYDKDIDLYCNRIHCYNPLTKKSLVKMADDITGVTKEILPDQKIIQYLLHLDFSIHHRRYISSYIYQY